MPSDKQNDKDKLPTRLQLKPPAKPTRKLNHGLPAVDANQIDNVRRHVLDTVKHNIPNARAVLAGRLRWTNQQVKLFQIMLNKVMPDLSASMNEHIHRQKSLSEMSRSELEAFVAKASKAEQEDPSDAIEALYEEIPEVPPEQAAELMEELEKDQDD